MLPRKDTLFYSVDYRFKKGNTELEDKVQKTLDKMAEDGTVDKIAEKYADYGVPGALCIGKNGK